jgi:hypothetical protein
MTHPDKERTSKELQLKPETPGSAFALVFLARYIQISDSFLKRVRQEGKRGVAVRLLGVTLSTLLAFAPDSEFRAVAVTAEGDKTEGTVPTPEHTETPTPTQTATPRPIATRTPEATVTPERSVVEYSSDDLYQKVFNDFFEKVRNVIKNEYPFVSEALIDEAVEIVKDSEAVRILSSNLTEGVGETTAVGEVLKVMFDEDGDGAVDALLGRNAGKLESVNISLNNIPHLPILIPIPSLGLRADKGGWIVGTEYTFVSIDLPAVRLDVSPTLLKITHDNIATWLGNSDEVLKLISGVDRSVYGYYLTGESLRLTETDLENPQGVQDVKSAVVEIGITLKFAPIDDPSSKNTIEFPLWITVPTTQKNGKLTYADSAVTVRITPKEDRATPPVTPDATKKPSGPKEPNEGAGIKIKLATPTPSN